MSLKRYIELLIIIIPLLISSCKKELDIVKDEKGSVIERPFLWKTPLTDKEEVECFVEGTITTQDGIIIGSMLGSEASYSMVNFNNGKILWTKEVMKKSDFFTIDRYYEHGSSIIFNRGPIYNLNKGSGEVKWQVRPPGYFWVNVTGIDSLFFLCGTSQKQSNPYRIESAYVGNVNTGEVMEFLFPDLGELPIQEYPNGAGGVEYILPWKNEDGDIMLVIYTTSLIVPQGVKWFGLYNFTKKAWVYDHVLFDHILVGPPQVFNNHIYQAMWFGFGCYDLYTGKQVWHYPIDNMFSSEGFVIADNKIIIAYEGMQKATLAIDIDKGRALWWVKTGGGPSKLSLLNGVVYFTSMGDGRLYAMEAETGKILWKLRSPEYQQSGHHFTWVCYVLPGTNGKKGKIITTTHYSAVCYEAER